ncbi:hypothetical protein WJN01_01405 [Flavobacteriaceae bacterium SZ-1-7]|uniref:hypothetical protein n=1 Tax=Tamlana sedimenti TaxID=3134126 RepID=UPI0031232177
MVSKLNCLFISIIFTVLLVNNITAQPQKGNFINANIGLGVSVPYDDYEIAGSGFYIQGEYVLGLKTWFGLRPYAGFITTSPNEDVTSENLRAFEVTSSAFLLGTKARIVAPIPWIAPYVEIGIGASIGSFTTYTPDTNKEAKGLLYHIPFTIGLALGPKHNVEVAFVYFVHPTVEHVNGAAALGLSFPLN